MLDILYWLPTWMADLNVNKVMQLNPNLEALGSCRAFLYNVINSPDYQPWTLISAVPRKKDSSKEIETSIYKIPSVVACRSVGFLMERYYLVALSSFQEEFFEDYEFNKLLEGKSSMYQGMLYDEYDFVVNHNLEDYLYQTILKKEELLISPDNFNETALALVTKLIDSGYPEELITVNLDPSTNLCTSFAVSGRQTSDSLK